MAEQTLSSPPSLAGLYAKALAGGLLPGGGDALPAHALRLDAMEVDPEHLAAYARVCGFRLSDTLPATYPHVFAFPLQMALMTDRSFPFSVLGLVHVANRIEQLRPLTLSDRPSLHVHAEGLRPHPRGRQFDLVAVGELDGEDVWRGRSTYLRRGKGGEEAKDGGGAREEPPRETSAVWSVPGDTGRRYAAVSGDRNPIHMSGLAAKLFGMPGAIAHGMWTKARCLAAFEGRLPRAFAIEVGFGAPLKVPAKAHFAERERGEGFEFALWRSDGERAYARGKIEAVAR